MNRIERRASAGRPERSPCREKQYPPVSEPPLNAARTARRAAISAAGGGARPTACGCARVRRTAGRAVSLHVSRDRSTVPRRSAAAPLPDRRCGCASRTSSIFQKQSPEPVHNARAWLLIRWHRFGPAYSVGQRACIDRQSPLIRHNTHSAAIPAGGRSGRLCGRLRWSPTVARGGRRATVREDTRLSAPAVTQVNGQRSTIAGGR